MGHLIAGGAELGWVAAKALLLYLTAVIGFRLGERRTLAQMSPFDFVAAIAVGAIVGRVPNASDASYLAGGVTLLTVLAGHACITRLRRFPSVAALLDRPPRLLVANGRVLDAELVRCGLARRDLDGALRQRGIKELSEVQYVIMEERGQISVLTRSEPHTSEPELIREILARPPSPAVPP